MDYISIKAAELAMLSAQLQPELEDPEEIINSDSTALMHISEAARSGRLKKA